MNKNTMYLVVAVLIVIIVVGVAGYMLLNNGGTDDTNATPTPGPSATVVGASTVQFSVNETTTATGDLVGYSFACKNYNTATEVVRVGHMYRRPNILIHSRCRSRKIVG